MFTAYITDARLSDLETSLTVLCYVAVVAYYVKRLFTLGRTAELRTITDVGLRKSVTQVTNAEELELSSS